MGPLPLAIPNAFPALRGVLFDPPDPPNRRGRRAKGRLSSSRCEIAAGHFFELVPMVMTLCLVTVLHDWSDKEAARVSRIAGAQSRRMAAC